MWKLLELVKTVEGKEGTGRRDVIYFVFYVAAYAYGTRKAYEICIDINNNFTEPLSNREFIRHKVDNFDVSKINNFNDKLLMLLKFEEYLLRKLFLEKKVLSDYITVKEYYDALFQFLNNNNINYKILDKELYVNINDEEYKFDYKIKKKVI